MTLTITFNKLGSLQPLMIVCHCHGVTDREIRNTVQCGARNCEEVAEACGASSGCGGCESLVAEIVHSERRRLAVVQSEVTASPRPAMPSLADAGAFQSA
jgi:bacterioferritin-associated ferredoxin